MKLALNLDNLTFVLPSNPAAPARSVTMRRDDILPIELLVYSGALRAELSDEAEVSAQLNVKDTFGGTGIASDAAFTKEGTGEDSIHIGTLDLSDSDVDSAFSSASNPAFIDAILEVKIEEGAHVQRTEPLAVRIQNSVNQS